MMYIQDQFNAITAQAKTEMETAQSRDDFLNACKEYERLLVPLMMHIHHERKQRKYTHAVLDGIQRQIRIKQRLIGSIITRGEYTELNERG